MRPWTTVLALLLAAPAAAETRLAVVGARTTAGPLAGPTAGAGDRLAKALREAELAVAPVGAVESAVGPERAQELTDCVLARDGACAMGAGLAGIHALAATELASDGRSGRLVVIAVPDGFVLYDETFRAPNMPALLTRLEEHGHKASRAVAIAFGDAPVISSRSVFGWSSMSVGMGFGLVSALFAGSAATQADVLARRGDSGPTSPVHAFELDQRLQRDRMFALGLGTAAVIAMGTGIYVLATPSGKTLPWIQVAPTANGVVVSGRFP